MDVTRREMLIAGSALLCVGAAESPSSRPSLQGGDGDDKLKVAAVQFRSGKNLSENVSRHRDYIRRCARDGARVVVFPECSVTGYTKEQVVGATESELREAERAIAAAARESTAYVIAGMPVRAGRKVFNSAIVAAPDCRIIERYHKVQLAGEEWATPGDHLSVFPIDGTLCSIIVCHDERYPELVRLPVLAGARIVFYISHESGMKEEHKVEPYRAQIVARAVENSVYVVQANAPGERGTLEGSHGQSRIISPSGHIVAEAGIWDEEVVAADLYLAKAKAGFASRSLQCDFLRDWWQEGVKKVRRVGLPKPTAGSEAGEVRKEF